jgi:hypothetical protein
MVSPIFATNLEGIPPNGGSPDSALSAVALGDSHDDRGCT